MPSSSNLSISASFIKRSASNVGTAKKEIKPSASNLSMKKEVIGGPPPIKNGNNPQPQSERALRRRMRSIERRSKILLYEEPIESPIQGTRRDDLWDFSVHGLFHKFLVLSFIAPLCELFFIPIFSWRNGNILTLCILFHFTE